MFTLAAFLNSTSILVSLMLFIMIAIYQIVVHLEKKRERKQFLEFINSFDEMIGIK